MRNIEITLVLLWLFTGNSFGQSPVDLSSFWNEDGSSKFENYKLDSIIGTQPIGWGEPFLNAFYRDVSVEYNQDCTIKSLSGTSFSDLPIHQFEFDNGLLTRYENLENEHAIIIEEYQYNLSGQLIQEIGSGGPDYSGNWVHDFLYDTLDRLVEIEEWGEFDLGTPALYGYDEIQSYKYDTFNNIIEALRLSSDRRDTLRFDSSIYDNNLLITEIIRQGTQREDTIRYEYDADDRLTKRSSFDFTQSILAQKLEEYRYSVEGNLIEYKISHEKENEFVGTTKTNYFYNSDNLEVRLEDYRFTEGEWQLLGIGEKRYNDHGLLTYEMREKGFKEFYLYYSDMLCTSSTTNDVYDLVISPNPTNKEFILKNEHFNIQRIELYDISGSRIFSKEKVSEQVNFGYDLLPGVYFLMISDDSGRYKSEMLIKQ